MLARSDVASQTLQSPHAPRAPHAYRGDDWKYSRRQQVGTVWSCLAERAVKSLLLRNPCAVGLPLQPPPSPRHGSKNVPDPSCTVYIENFCRAALSAAVHQRRSTDSTRRARPVPGVPTSPGPSSHRAGMATQRWLPLPSFTFHGGTAKGGEVTAAKNLTTSNPRCNSSRANPLRPSHNRVSVV